MKKTTRVALACVAVLVVGAGAITLTPSTSLAACAFLPPQTKLQRVSPGESFGVHEEGFAADCYDTGQQGQPPPERNIPISLQQEGKEWRLATVDAGPPPRYAVDARLTVPEEAEPGRAVVAIHTRLAAEPFEVPISVVESGELADTGGPDLWMLMAVSCVLATTTALLARRALR